MRIELTFASNTRRISPRDILNEIVQKSASGKFAAEGAEIPSRTTAQRGRVLYRSCGEKKPVIVAFCCADNGIARGPYPSRWAAMYWATSPVTWAIWSGVSCGVAIWYRLTETADPESGPTPRAQSTLRRRSLRN